MNAPPDHVRYPDVPYMDGKRDDNHGEKHCSGYDHRNRSEIKIRKQLHWESKGIEEEQENVHEYKNLSRFHILPNSSDETRDSIEQEKRSVKYLERRPPLNRSVDQDGTLFYANRNQKKQLLEFGPFDSPPHQ